MAEMNLVHYSENAELVPISARDHPAMQAWRQKRPYHHKPVGLWVSDEDDYGWSEWCKDNKFLDTAKQRAFTVTVKDDANILYVRNALEMVLLDEMLPGDPRMVSYDFAGRMSVDWTAVMDTYQGVIITPYMWALRLPMRPIRIPGFGELPSMDWYYTWDCASGCIWDADAIASVVPLVRARAE